MSKLVTGGALALVVAVGAAGGGMVYADKHLEAAYRGEYTKSKMMQMQVEQFSMGVASGAAKWTMKLVPDMCHQQQALSLRGEDVIQRGVNGYHITSKVYLAPEKGEEVFLFNADSQASWSGALSSHWSVPANVYETTADDGGQMKLSWAEVTMDMLAKKDANGQYALDNWRMSLPEMVFNSTSTEANPVQLALKDLQYRSDVKMDEKTGLSGKDEFSLAHLSASSAGTVSSVDNLKSTGTYQTENGFVDMNHTTKLGSFKIGEQTFSDIQFNGSLKHVDKSAIEAMMKLMERQGQECVPEEERVKIISEALVAVARQGFALESKDNQILLNQDALRATASASLPAGTYADVSALMEQLPQVMKYQARAEMDKGFAMALMRLVNQQRAIPASEAELEQEVNQFAEAMQARVEGNKLVLERSN